MSSLPSFISVILYGFFVLFSMAGWGFVLNRILYPSFNIDWSERATWGIAFTVVLGGVLNLLSFISPFVIVVYLTVGFIFFIGSGWLQLRLSNGSQRSKNSFFTNRYARIYFAFVVAILFFRFVGFAYTTGFNLHDDFHAYLVFPHKMLQTGSLGDDPFGGRRLYAVLGGQSFLHALILSVLPVENVRYFDLGIALVVNAGLLFSLCKRLSLSYRKNLCVFLIFLTLPWPIQNITVAATPIVLLIGFCMALHSEYVKQGSLFSNIFILGLLSSAICALKSSLLPIWFFTFLLGYFFLFIRSRNRLRLSAEFMLCGFSCVFFLLPWMISLFQSSGTLFYPLLGNGYFRTAYGSSLYTNRYTGSLLFEIFLNGNYIGYLAALVLLLVVYIYLNRKELEKQGLALTLGLSGLFSTVCLFFIVREPDMNRYVYSALYAAILVLVPYLLAHKRIRFISVRPANIPSLITGTTLLVLFTYQFYTMSRQVDFSGFKNKVSTISGSAELDNGTVQYKKLQEAVPAGEVMLARLDMPFLLNFKKNKIFIADEPGYASPPPGMPTFKGSEALANYLLDRSVRYVAYSYKSEAGFSKEAFSGRLKWELYDTTKTMALLTFDFQDNLEKLGRTRRRIYDDGENFVLDLAAPKTV